MSLEEHRHLANEIYTAADCLMRVSRRIWPAYRVSSRVAKLAGRAFNGGRDLKNLRSELDNCFFREHPDAEASPYYDPKRAAELQALMTDAFRAAERRPDFIDS